MNSICFFSSYFTSPEIPGYITYYLSQLKRYFRTVVIYINDHTVDERQLSALRSAGIEYRMVKNEGFDFGMWYKAFREFDVNEYDRIGLVNDSCILFAPPDRLFQWIDSSDCDYCGFSGSNAIAYHVQSYFIVIKKKAIGHVARYFEKTGVLSGVHEVIRRYEVGLSEYLAAAGIKTGAMFSFSDYRGEFNPVILYCEDLIRQKVPLIKKKILRFSFRPEEMFTLMRMNFRSSPHYYAALIGRHNPDARLDLVQSAVNSASPFRLKMYAIARTIFNAAKAAVKRIKPGAA